MPLQKQPLTWLGYIQKITSHKFEQPDLSIDGIEKVLSINQQFNNFFYHSVPMVYMLDYTTGRYLTMSKSARHILGYTPADFYENGVNFTIENYHTEDLKLYDEKVFPDRLKFLKHIPAEEYNKYIFSYNFRFRNKNGEYVNLLQRNCYIKSDVSGNPLISFGMVLNIGDYKTENPVIQLVEKISSDNEKTDVILKNGYYLNSEDKLFSRREKEILLWTADGFTSKEIAEKLSLSESTVINHRKNMLLKSGCKNIAELISFSFRNNII